MFIYTFSKDPLRMGEHDSTYGQTWWGTVNEMQYPVKFNLSTTDNLTVESRITCEEQAMKKSAKKGTEYYQLKKVKVQDNSAIISQPDSGPKQPSTTNRPGLLPTQLDRIEAKLDQLINGEVDESIDTAPLPEYPESDY